jgi:hypothetical protein
LSSESDDDDDVDDVDEACPIMRCKSARGSGGMEKEIYK